MNADEKSLHKQAVASGQLHREENYWLKKLSGDLVRCNFPYDRPKSQNIRRMESVEFKFSGDIDSKLMKLMNNSDVRLHMILTAALMVLVYKYTGNHDILIGTPVLKQEREAEFVNTVLVLRSRIDKDQMSFKDFLLQAKQSMVEANENQNYPIDRLPIQLGIPYSQNEDFPLFDIAILLGNIQDKSYIEHINTNVIISFFRTGETVSGVLQYNSFLYESATINRIVLNFINLASEVLSNPLIEIDKILMMSGEEKERLLVDFNNSSCDYPKDKTIHELFADQVEKMPDKTAIVDSNNARVLSYHQLNEKANRLGHRLISQGLAAGDIVGVLLERSLDMVIALLGILKAGGAYLPIDTYYPGNRIRYMLADSNVKILITREKLGKDASTDGRTIISPGDEDLYRYNSCNPGRISRPDSLLYVIYTSGSTGKPKGVLVAHKGFVNLVRFHRQLFGQDHDSHMSQVANPGFDAMAFEVWPCLVYGAVLYIASDEIRVDAAKLTQWLIRSEIAISYQPTVMALLLLNAQWPQENISLRALIAAGDRLTQRPATGHPFRLYNLYGPTEDTVWTTWSQVSDRTAGSHLPHIGQPIANHEVYILGAHFKLQPIGVPGEICIGGDGLALGYLNRPKLTHERFVSNPFVPGERLYRTGDRGRWLQDGNIDFLGRMDQQVKIRGFRIELGEIENHLLAHHNIEKTVVLAREHEKGEKYLCAYVTANDGLNVLELKDYLLTELPAYMIPARFVEVGHIPLTPNGKVDKKALYEMDAGAALETDYMAPRNETERKITAIWEELLHIEKVGVKDNFFNIGGDSIKTISLVTALNKEFDVTLEILDLYENETVEKIVSKIGKAGERPADHRREEVLQEIKELENKIMSYDLLVPLQDNIEEIYPLSDIQAGMAFYYLKGLTASYYHNQMVFQLKEKEFNPGNLNKALAMLVEKHSILRTGFHMFEFNEPVQLVFRKIPLTNVEHFNISHLDSSEWKEHLELVLAEDRRHGFNVSTAEPLWRLKTFALDSENISFIWICHHAMIDGWSSAALITELSNLYHQLKENPEFVPEKLKSTYKEFVIQQRVWKKGTDAITFWRNELDGYRRFEFPSGIKTTHPTTASARRNRSGYILETSLLENLRKLARDFNTSVKHLCFASYVYMLNLLSYENDIVVGLITNNRPACEDGEKILGCFLNSVPVRIRFPDRITWRDYINLVNNKILELKRFDAVPLFEILRIVGEKTQNRNPIFDSFFNFVDFHVYDMLNQDGFQETSPDNADEQLSLLGTGETNTLFDFTINVTAGGFTTAIAYSESIIDEPGVERCFNYFRRILNQLVVEPDSFMAKAEILSLEEKASILSLNDAGEGHPDAEAYPPWKTIHEMFESQAGMAPDKTAVVYKNSWLTYNELNKKSNQVAHLLREKGIVPGAIVGILSEPSPDIIIGVLAVLKAGGAFLPCEPEFPEERLNFMLNDSQAKIVIAQSHLTEKVNFNGEMLIIDDSGHTENTDLRNLSLPSDLCYVIYTSGSTGKPKGVQVQIENLVNYTSWFKRQVNLTDTDKTPLTSSFAFDLGYTSIFPSLMTGGQLHVIEKSIYLSDADIIDYISKNGMTYLKMTPSLFTIIINSPFFSAEAFRTLRLLVLGGESIKVTDVEKVSGSCSHVHIMNHYGPTETAIGSIAKPIDSTDLGEYKENPTIGYAIDNTQIYILDKNLNMQPLGIPGELCISGDGLARGYLNQVELTAEKFVKNPFDNGKRLYRTGDLARFLPGGDVEFLGRLDRQKKIRGYRIELGEIENQLLSFANIEEVIVVNYGDNGGIGYLCAYLVSNIEIDIPDLKNVLASKLPRYMIPAYFIQIDNIPLTANGKIDRDALPMPGDGQKRQNYVAPRFENEERLVTIWSDILHRGVDTIGIDDDFFELNGHSLNAVLLIGRIYKTFNVRVPLVEIFNAPTIRKLAESISLTGMESGIGKDENMLLMKRNSTAADHFFFIHDASGEVNGYTEFCNNLMDSFNYWGIGADRLTDYAPKNQDIEEIARDHIKKIKKLQKKGPFYIAGWSLGGTIAFEMVRQLEEMDEEVGCFAMIDSMAPNHNLMADISEFTLMSELDWILSHLPATAEIRGKLAKISDISSLWEYLVNYLEANCYTVGDIVKRIPGEQSRLLLGLESLNLKELIKFINRIRTLLYARAVYTPCNKIKTPVHFFYASQSGQMIGDKWSEYCDRSLETYEIAGTHFSIFEKPQVLAFAKIFAEMTANVSYQKS